MASTPDSRVGRTYWDHAESDYLTITEYDAQSDTYTIEYANQDLGSVVEEAEILDLLRNATWVEQFPGQVVQ